jgi:glycosyltransferase involved in cell wall biosynthesis
VSETRRPQCLLVTFLSLTRYAGRSSGSHRRLSLLVEAVRQSGASLRVVCSLTPEEATPSVEAACRTLERELSDYWGLEVSVVASVSAPPPTKQWIVIQAESALSYSRTQLIRSRVTPEACALIATEVAKKPAYILAHRLPAMHALNSTAGVTMPVVFDLDDIEHVIAVRHARQEHSIRNKVFGFATVPNLVAAERRGVSHAARTLVCSQVDAERMRKLFKTDKIDVIPNAMPLPERVVPIVANKQMLMVAAYGYDPNADAAEFFITQVLPLVRARVPEAELHLVGASPQSIPSFARKPAGVKFLGYAEDLAATYAGSRIIVCPIRYGGGTRVKLVEAAGWGKPIVSTTIGAEGLGMVDGNDALIADTPEAFANACVSLLNDDELCRALARSARSLAEQSFDGKRIAEQLGAKLRAYVKA